MFGCTAYVLRIPCVPKFEPRALEGVYLETLERGVFSVLVTQETGILQILESRHVIFDESKYPSAPSLVSYLDDEDASDYDFSSASGSGSVTCSFIASDHYVSVDDFDDEDCPNDPDLTGFRFPAKLILTRVTKVKMGIPPISTK